MVTGIILKPNAIIMPRLDRSPAAGCLYTQGSHTLVKRRTKLVKEPSYSNSQLQLACRETPTLTLDRSESASDGE